MTTLLATARVIKLKVEVNPDRRCVTVGCKYFAPAPGPRRCAFCRAMEAIERSLRKAAEVEDAALIDAIAEVVETVAVDAELWTDPVYRQVIGLGIDAAAAVSRRADVEAVRKVRDPVLDDPDDDFWGMDRDYDRGRAALAAAFDRNYDPNGPSASDVERAALNHYLSREL